MVGEIARPVRASESSSISSLALFSASPVEPLLNMRGREEVEPGVEALVGTFDDKFARFLLSASSLAARIAERFTAIGGRGTEAGAASVSRVDSGVERGDFRVA